VVSSAALSDLIESITLDAYGTDEQLGAFLAAFSEEVRVPCPATVLHLPVEVLAFDAENDERRGLVVLGGRGGRRVGVVSLVDVRFEPRTVGAWLHAEYRSWLGLAPFPSRRPTGWSWAER
jgi:hypothetical protein